MTRFNHYLHDSMQEALLIVSLIDNNAPREDILAEKEILHHELSEAALDL